MIVPFALSSELLTTERCHIITMLGGDVDGECSIARARVESGITTQMHALNGITERYVILKGVGRMDVGNETAEVRELDVVLIPPGAPQRITNTGSDDLLFLCLCTPPFRAEAYIDLESSSRPGRP
jgi:mannose-6-phosphate isomerase-like protein (cupin superfamily)